jgi:molecular chaperone HtpG
MENTNANRHEFQIYLPGLLKVLAESLYSTKKVAIRELIQNAHDSCIRRRVETRDALYEPRIDISIDPDARTVTIKDNGAGLTADGVRTYLSTIGRSYTRQLGEDLSILSPEQASQLIGQFGMGFLSAFLVASEVVLTTRNVEAGSPTLQWRSEGDVHYELTEIEYPDGAAGPVGTQVELHIKPNAAFMLNQTILADTIKQYADFLPISIHMDDDYYPLNARRPPWEALEPITAMREFVQSTYRMQQPLALIPLQDATLDLGHDTMTIPMQGFLFVPPASMVSVNEYGDMRVYIKRMFICERQRELLPKWARFVRGVIDSTYLAPTASREELHQDDLFMLVQQAIEQQLLQGLRHIADTEPENWKQIVRGHASLIMGWAVEDNEFFEQIAEIMTIQTSRGNMPLRDYLQQTDNTFYYITRQLGSLQERLLGEGHGVPVIDASPTWVTPFLKKYAAYREDVDLVQLDGESSRLMRDVPDEDFITVLNFFRDQGLKCKAVTFKPVDVPAIIMYPKDAEFIRDTRSALDSGELPGPLAGLVGDYVDQLADAHGNDLGGTLYLNVSNDLMRQMSYMDESPQRNAALSLVYQMARLFSGRMLDNPQVADAFRDANSAINKLLEID